MGGIAQLAQALGHTVSGSDQNVYPPMSTQLENAGIELMQGYDPAHLSQCNGGAGPDQVVIGNAMSRGNAAVESVLNQGMSYTSGPQWLAENVLQNRWILAVAGTHGKTTTSSILAWLLESAGLNPGFLIGGVPNNFGVSARLGGSPFFVIEADEYDTAFFDKRSKFVHYRPRTLILNNLEFDHADIFAGLDDIKRQFHHLLRTVPGEGLVIANAEDENLAAVLQQGCWSTKTGFSRGTANIESEWNIQANNDDANEFKLFHDKRSIGKTRWPMLGTHNALNAVAALIAARHVGVEPHTSLAALSAFSGVKRRLEVYGVAREVTVYDDFAHHPTAIELTLAGLRGRVGNGRIIAVFEPRSNTMRMGVHDDKLLPSFGAADAVRMYHKEGDGFKAHLLEKGGAGIKNPAENWVLVYPDLDALIAALAAEARGGDHILVMSNGGFGGLHAKLLDALQN